MVPLSNEGVAVEPETYLCIHPVQGLPFLFLHSLEEIQVSNKHGTTIFRALDFHVDRTGFGLRALFFIFLALGSPCLGQFIQSIYVVELWV